MKTMIEASYIIAHNGDTHRILKDGVLVFEGDRILHVGKIFEGSVDRTIDATGKLISPGLINMHAAASTSVTMLRIDGLMSALSVGKAFALEGEGALELSTEELGIISRFAWAGLLKDGATTSVAITPMIMSRWESPLKQAGILATTAGEIGTRAYISHQFRSAVKYVDREGVTHYEWDEVAGQAGLERSLLFNERTEGSFNDRVRTMLFPYKLDTCSPELLRATKAAADKSGYPIHMHVSETLSEFHETLRLHGKTPIRYLYDMGFLSPSVITTHVLYSSYHPHSGFTRGDTTDLELLGKSGATVAHCPAFYSRGLPGGGILHSFGQFSKHGVNMVLGTDTYPFDMLHEMRAAVIMGKLADLDERAVTARHVFDAATTNAAKALNRPDLGRLAAGAKADLSIVDFTRLHLGLVDDPIKTLVYMANQTDIESVFVDGEEVVCEGRIPNLDEISLARAANAIQQKQKRTIIEHHPSEIAGDRLFPQSYPDIADVPPL